jgi:hypothetical protein
MAQALAGRAAARHATALACAIGALLGAGPAAAQEDRTRVGEALQQAVANLRSQIRPRSGGVLGLMGYNAVPDGSANAIQLNRSSSTSEEGDATLTLGQFGLAFTVSEDFPLYLEGYLGYARYDPRAMFSGGVEDRRTPFKWNNVAATVGVGWDFALGDNLWIRPIINTSLAYAASDLSLAGSFINLRRGVDISPLTDAHMNVYGYGGSLVLAYYDYRPTRDIDVELRYTHLRLETFGDTLPVAQGQSVAQTVGLWTRYRWPTGVEVFGRPLRWVYDGSFSYYLGDQRDSLGFAWAAKVGGGIEFDTGRWELGAMGINLERVRLIGRYLFADNNITGWSFGLGMSF